MKIKILIAIPVPSSFLSGLLRATSYLGIETRVFNCRGHTLFEKLVIGTTGQGDISTRLLNQRLIQAATTYKPDILLVMKGELVSGETINTIHNFGIKTVNWFPDGFWTLDLITDIVSYYDTFLHFDSLVCDFLQKKGHKNVRYLPYAADILPTDNPPRFNIKKYPATFIGNYHPEREAHFKKIADSGFYIWGGKAWENTSLAANYQGVCKYKDVSRILSESVVSLNFHYHAKSNGANLRVYESTAAGACLLTDYKKDLEKLFVIDEEIVTYKNIGELTESLDYLNTNKDVALKIGKKGYKRTKSHNTYIHRIKDLLTMV